MFDAPLLLKADKVNYAIKAENCGNTLLALKVEPYNLLLFGSELVADELLEFLIMNNYEIKSLLGSEVICDKVVDVLKSKYNIEYFEALAMDFMEAKERTEPSSDEVTVPFDNDLNEIVDCIEHFIKDCGLADNVNVKSIRDTIGNFRIIREDDKIISMARMIKSTDNNVQIAAVYTRPEYRGRGYARKVVNTIKNEIIDMGMTATLNVDKKNPISNKLYKSLGFVKVFSQGEYRRKNLAI